MGNPDREKMKREKFLELAEARTGRAIQSIRVIGNLSNRSNYSYTTEEVLKIIKALDSEVRDLKSRFNYSNSRSKSDFKL